MALVPYKVYVVVDREFGEKLSELEEGVPVWIVDTATNKTVVQRFWNERPRPLPPSSAFRSETAGSCSIMCLRIESD